MSEPFNKGKKRKLELDDVGSKSKKNPEGSMNGTVKKVRMAFDSTECNPCLSSTKSASSSEAANNSNSGPSEEQDAETQGEKSVHLESKTKRRRKRKGKSGEEGQPRLQIRKLVPPRPFPTVDPASSATGPRSSHVEGKNRICITRKTPLGMYLRRCKDLILKDGYKTLYLCAMGAAISHCNRLAVSLPSILPHSRDAIQTEMKTGTTEVRDEVIPEDDNEDIYFQTRVKATLNVVIKIDGGDEGESTPEEGRKKRIRRGRRQREVARNGKEASPHQIVFKEMDVDQLEEAIME